MKSGDGTTEPEGQLIRGIGFAGSAFLVLNGMIGAGIFALPAAVAERAGALSPWLFLGAGLLIIPIVLTFAELASYFRASGGPALYATEAFGPLAGFGTGWMYYVSRVVSFAANTHVMAVYLGTVWGWFDTVAGHTAVVLVTCFGLTVANVVGVRGGVRTLSVFTLLKLLPLVLLVLAGLKSIGPDVLFPAAVPTIDDLGGTMLLVIYAFVGFESVLVPAGETASPRRTIPTALIRTVIAISVFYLLIVLVYVAVLGDELDQGGTLVDIGRRLAGPVGAIVITLAAVFSVSGNLSASILSTPRLTLSLAENGLLPGWFGRIHPRYASPANSVLFYGILAAALGVTGSFAFLAITSSLARLITYVVCILALPVLKRTADDATLAGAYRLPGGFAIPVLALVICVWMAWHSPVRSWLYVAVLLAAGLLLYAVEARFLRMRRDGA